MNTSPLPVQVAQTKQTSLPVASPNIINPLVPGMLTFPEAMTKVVEGKKVTRLNWEDKEIYGFMNTDEWLTLHLKDGNHQWLVNKGDMVATDWIVI